MDLELAGYIMEYYRSFMTEPESKAYSNLVLALKTTGRNDRGAQEETGARGPLNRYLHEDPEALRLAADGYEAFLLRTAERILRDHPAEVFLNRCPKCGGLARTPRARQCPHCYHTWHHLPRPEPPGS